MPCGEREQNPSPPFFLRPGFLRPDGRRAVRNDSRSRMVYDADDV